MWSGCLSYFYGKAEMKSHLLSKLAETNTRFIIVTGGVCSSLGKGVLASSLGALLVAAGYSVTLAKCDPYLNIDPGTMSPHEHGEVFVTADGTETDLDIGHYERALGIELTGKSSITSGKVFRDILAAERAGKYLGKNVQLIPHVVNDIDERFIDLAFSETGEIYDFVIIEIGGTVGDIEGEIFLESIRQLRYVAGRERVIHCHLSYVPYIAWANEVKSKPTQHSVMLLKRAGLVPDMLFARTEVELDDNFKQKLATYCDVSPEHVFVVPTRKPQYLLLRDLKDQCVDEAVQKIAGLPNVRPSDMTEWEGFFGKLLRHSRLIKIGLIGKYIGENDPYISLYEALKSAGYAHDVAVELSVVSSEALEALTPEQLHAQLSYFDGLVVPGGFGERGTEGKIRAIRWIRENGVPFFGICLGLQMMLIEAARTLVGLSDATSEEFNSETTEPVIAMMADQKRLHAVGGTMRLGNYTCELKPGSKAAEAYGEPSVLERHRHRYEFNNKYRAQLEAVGVTFSGINPETGLVEIAEIASHPFMVAVQYHPEYKSTPLKPHRLFKAFMAKAIERNGKV